MITPFTDAACQTFKLLLDVDTITETAQKCEEEGNEPCHTDIAIEVTGDLTGEVLYRFPEETTLEIVKCMSGMEFTAVDEFVLSALGEIANIISGNAMTYLSEKDITCDIQPPKIVDGEPQAAAKQDLIYSTKINTQIGDVAIMLKLNPDRLKK